MSDSIKLIRCYADECRHYAYRLLVIHEGFNDKYLGRSSEARARGRAHRYPLLENIAYCRSHFEKFVASTHQQYSEWKGLLFPHKMGFRCSHLSCEYAATSYFWKTTRKQSIYGIWVKLDDHLEFCRFHANVIMRDPGEYRQLELDEFNQKYVESVLES